MSLQTCLFLSLLTAVLLSRHPPPPTDGGECGCGLCGVSAQLEQWKERRSGGDLWGRAEEPLGSSAGRTVSKQPITESPRGRGPGEAQEVGLPVEAGGGHVLSHVSQAHTYQLFVQMGIFAQETEGMQLHTETTLVLAACFPVSALDWGKTSYCKFLSNLSNQINKLTLILKAFWNFCLYSLKHCKTVCFIPFPVNCFKAAQNRYFVAFCLFFSFQWQTWYRMHSIMVHCFPC